MKTITFFKTLLMLITCVIVSRTLVYGQSNSSPREHISFNQGWSFYDAQNFGMNAVKDHVTLPHTWNADAPLKGGYDYKRGTGIYENNILFQEQWKNKRVFLYFEGANSVATIFINDRFVQEHRGGYSAFCVEVTSFLKSGENKVKVLVSNALRIDVLPLGGDFTVYGGIHRPVSILVTNPDCITPLDYASPGVFITQSKVSDKEAALAVRTQFSFTNGANGFLHTRILDKKGVVVLEQTSPVADTTLVQNFTLKNPHLWNGKADPYLYTVKTEFLQNDRIVDAVTQPLGVRYYHVDPDKGFFLNGKYLDLHGANRHADVYGKGSALSKEDYDREMDLINELGATAMRLAHYQYCDYAYQQADENGIVLWTEIPQIGPGGYTSLSFVNTSSYKAQARQCLIELIRQNYNHPSVFFWGLMNELRLSDNPEPFIKELGELARKEDPSRLTTLASFVETDFFTNVSDVMAWNRYSGWYGGKFEDDGLWFDQAHKTLPKKPMAVSEYGAGASPFKHQEVPKQVVPTSKFHPEEWQTAFHEAHWASFKTRPFIWGKFVWVLSDMGSAVRTEGDQDGVNDKGLVTYDRKTKKDAFYFYKANWNPEPMLVIAEKRNNERKIAQVNVKAYSNIPEATLWVNGTKIGSQKKNDINIILWKGITLKKGKNTILVKAKNLQDTVEWTLTD